MPHHSPCSAAEDTVAAIANFHHQKGGSSSRLIAGPLVGVHSLVWERFGVPWHKEVLQATVLRLIDVSGC